VLWSQLTRDVLTSSKQVMMHNGLSHFAGRGLPTIWSVMTSSQAEVDGAPVFPFTDRDAQVIREWARSLDDWLVSSNRESRAAKASRTAHITRTDQYWVRRRADSTTVQPLEDSTFSRTASCPLIDMSFFSPRVQRSCYEEMTREFGRTGT
jgi:hypothetical protein